MAELPNLGKHCSFSGCNQLDFLPVECPKCKKIFCKEHYHTYDHDCDKGVKDKATPMGTASASSSQCSFSDCDRREAVDIVCQGCTRPFCLEHRNPEGHKCPSLAKTKQEDMTETKKLVEKITAGSPHSDVPKRPRNLKSQKLAAKVQLMKLKMKSKGNMGLPVEERIYFRAILPKGSKEKTAGVFVSKNWTLGKVVDSVASLIGVENKNNEQGADKLRLFRYTDGKNLCEELDGKLSKLIDAEELFNGDAVILEYVKEPQNYVDPKDYSDK